MINLFAHTTTQKTENPNWITNKFCMVSGFFHISTYSSHGGFDEQIN